ncbi:MAG TPA: ABC transporter permease [Blastocatellia bacterium]|nr:ABC transporter permease [Blastocatellia bacterium]
MHLLSRFRSLLSNVFHREHAERELDEEMSAHLDLLIDEKIAAGLSVQEARRNALIEFGGLAQVKEQVRDVRMGALIEQVWLDAGYAVRILLKNPSFTALVVITLALGIGVNTAIFSLVDGILLRPLPFERPDRLVRLVQSQSQLGLPLWNLSQATFTALRDNNTHSLEAIAAYSTSGANLTGGGDPERVSVGNVSADFFKVLGVQPLLGRTFRAGEDTPGNNGVCVISFGFWQRQFGGDPNMIGRSLNLNSIATEVIGVMPAGFSFPRPETEIWVPLAINPTRTAPYFLRAIARLAPGVLPSDAEAETTEGLWDYARKHPDTSEARVPLDKGSALKTVVTPLKDAMVGATQKPLLILLGAVGLVLLIACANIANLLLARATSRVKELAVRFALGASPSRVARQLLTESLVLSVIGAAGGVLLAWLGVRMLDRLPIEGIPRIEGVALDARVLTFTAGLAVLTGLLFGLMPALRAYRMGMVAAMHEGGRGSSSSHRANRALVAAQFALSFVLLIGAGLLLKSLHHLESVSLGFNPDRLLTMLISLPARKYAKPEQTVQFYQSLMERMSGMPGIRSAAITSGLPFTSGGNTDNFIVEGHPPDTAEGVQAQLVSMAPGHLQVMEIPLLRGRDFLETDNADSQSVAIVDETLARMYWPDGDALGKRVETTGDMTWLTIVGVVGGIKEVGLAEELQPHIYVPLAQGPTLQAQLAVRTDGPFNTLIGAIRSEVSEVDPEIPVYSIRAMNDVIGRTLNSQRLTNILLTAFSVLALLLAAVGIYGTMALYVASRKKEFGIRLALGAPQAVLLRLVLREGMVLIATGVAIGIAGAAAMSRAIESLLFEVSPTDPAVLIAVPLLLVLVALAACFVPARRASRIDPMIALRVE